MIRIDHGFDVHKFGGEGPLTICGEKIPFEQGFIAHSDGDVAIHALCDALLGAVGLGDIGEHFPPSDKKWKNSPSKKFLTHVHKMVTDREGTIVNIDLTFICEAPKQEKPRMPFSYRETLGVPLLLKPQRRLNPLGFPLLSKPTNS